MITPIIKKAGSDPLDAKSYRPVSNLSYMSKLVERMVSRRLTRYLEGEKLLPKFQSGFRARHSTETAILKVLSDILTAADLGKVSILGLLDMSAAFDTVDHSILFDRLETAYVCAKNQLDCSISSTSYVMNKTHNFRKNKKNEMK